MPTYNDPTTAYDAGSIFYDQGVTGTVTGVTVSAGTVTGTPAISGTVTGNTSSTGTVVGTSDQTPPTPTVPQGGQVRRHHDYDYSHYGEHHTGTVHGNTRSSGTCTGIVGRIGGHVGRNRSPRFRPAGIVGYQLAGIRSTTETRGTPTGVLRLNPRHEGCVRDVTRTAGTAGGVSAPHPRIRRDTELFVLLDI